MGALWTHNVKSYIVLQLNSLKPWKTANILQTTFLMRFVVSKLLYSDPYLNGICSEWSEWSDEWYAGFSLTIVYETPAWVQVTAWRRIGGKVLSEPILALFTNAFICVLSICVSSPPSYGDTAAFVLVIAWCRQATSLSCHMTSPGHYEVAHWTNSMVTKMQIQ